MFCKERKLTWILTIVELERTNERRNVLTFCINYGDNLIFVSAAFNATSSESWTNGMNFRVKKSGSNGAANKMNSLKVQV